MAELFKIQRLVEIEGKEVLQDVHLQIPYEHIENKPIVFDVYAKFPETGTSGILYIATDKGKCYV